MGKGAEGEFCKPRSFHGYLCSPVICARETPPPPAVIAMWPVEEFGILDTWRETCWNFGTSQHHKNTTFWNPERPGREPSIPIFTKVLPKQKLYKNVAEVGKQDLTPVNPSQGDKLIMIVALGRDRCMGRASRIRSPSWGMRMFNGTLLIPWW